GVGPDQLRIRELLTRMGATEDGNSINELIIATDPNTEGEATATYLVRMLRDFPGLTVTRLASGLPMGGDLEFADELTLGRALSGRRTICPRPVSRPHCWPARPGWATCGCWPWTGRPARARRLWPRPWSTPWARRVSPWCRRITSPRGPIRCPGGHGWPTAC